MSKRFLEINSNQYNENKYDSVYREDSNSKYSIIREPDIEYEKQVHYLSVSSRDRNLNNVDWERQGSVMNKYVNSYIIHFTKEYKNIHTIELIQAIIPAKNGSEAEPYLLLTIDEIEEVICSNDKNIANSFAILQLAPPTTQGGFVAIDKTIHENTVKYYQTPKANLSKMTIRIYNSDGVLFDFGPNSDTLNKEMQNTFIFKIVTLEKKRKEINFRNVY